MMIKFAFLHAYFYIKVYYMTGVNNKMLYNVTPRFLVGIIYYGEPQSCNTVTMILKIY